MENSLIFDGIGTKDKIDSAFKNFDFNDPSLCADFKINQMKNRNKDYVLRTEFDDYTVISGIIDSTTKGKVCFGYGHGLDYFNNKNGTISSYHELMADYTSLKFRENTNAIGFLRKVLGDDIFNMVDSTYQHMLQ